MPRDYYRVERPLSSLYAGYEREHYREVFRKSGGMLQYCRAQKPPVASKKRFAVPNMDVVQVYNAIVESRNSRSSLERTSLISIVS